MTPTVTPPAEKQRRCLHLSLESRGWTGRRGLQCFLRIGPECPECNQSELTWASIPDCGIATTRKALRHRQACAQNKGLNRASRLQTTASLVTGKQSRKGAIAAPEKHYLPNRKQAFC